MNPIRHWRGLTLAIMALVLTACAHTPAPTAARPLTILVSIDGFRADYLDRGVTPVLSGLAASGARGAMRPSFPSKTFPNHYTLVTGLRPDETGIVSNNMWDPAKSGVTFSMSNRDAVKDGDWWSEAEPIWITAERAGIVTAPIFWPGSEATINGLRPHYFRTFDMTVPSEARVDQDLALLDSPPAERPRFMTLYFDTVDTAGHKYGPDSAEVNAAAAGVDAQIGRLLEGLKQRGIVANVVVVSDHGMAATSPDRVLYVDDLLLKDAYKSLDLGSFGTIFPANGREAEVEKVLTARRPHLQCWPKAKVPRRLHYGKNPRVAPIVCMPQVGWTLTTHDYHPKEGPAKGEHGYDNAAPEMRAIFVAAGPAFRSGVRLETIDNVDLYPLLARLVGVAPGHNDGNPAILRRALVP
jgi:predicted AlkP superfamily pyrophosphatase or phosphodiesterase